jgi:hypothetical protein
MVERRRNRFLSKKFRAGRGFDVARPIVRIRATLTPSQGSPITGHASKTILRRLAAAATLGAAIFIPAVVAHAQTDRMTQICRMAAIYDATHDDGFIDLFDSMAFDRGICAGASSSDACGASMLVRWQGGMNIAATNLPSTVGAEDRVTMIMRSAAAAARTIVQAQGLGPKAVRVHKNPKHLRTPGALFIIGTVDEAHKLAAAFFSRNTADYALQMERIMRGSMRLGPQCWAFSMSSDLKSGVLNGGLAFVDIDLTPEKAADCARENIFTLFVPGAQPGMDPSAARADPYFAERAYAVLKLAYHPALTTGMPRADALAAATRILTECPK